MDRQALYEELVDAFIDFQWRQENPMPLTTETREMKVIRYQTNDVFHSKVKSMACGVMSIVAKHDGLPTEIPEHVK